MKENKFHINSLFTLEKAAGDATQDESIKIVGYANTVTKDRYGDVIPSDAWTKGGLMNYQKNPVLLAFHNHSKPAGKVTGLVVDEKGLKIEAEVSTSSEVYNFVKEGILKAFSIGASIKDAQYDSDTDTFVIKDLELLEVSIVSVPANQDSLFSLAKSFDSDEAYADFKKQYLPKEDEVKELSDPVGKTEETINMNEEQMAALAKSIAEATTKAQAEAAEKAAVERAAIDKAAITMTDNTQKLVDEITKRFEARMNEKDLEVSKTLEGLHGAIKEKSGEIEALMKSKMHFTDPASRETVSYGEKETAYLLSKILSKKMGDTNYGKRVLEKANASAHASTTNGGHVAGSQGGDWEQEISNTIVNELRKKLILAPLFRNIDMPLSVMRFPVNPEAGYANWVTANQLGTTASTGTAVKHQLTDMTLTTYKLATKEFIVMEEEEDTVLPLLPIIREAIVRRMAKAHDVALLRGATTEGTGTASGIDTVANTPGDFYGLTRYAVNDSKTATLSTTSAFTVANLIDLRRKLGTWGLDPSELMFIVSEDAYYDLLNDDTFKDSAKIGADKNVLRTGQVGSVLNIPVVLSGEFKSKGVGNFAAVCVYANNFLHGEQRGLTLESEYRIEEQSKMLVATRRLAFKQIGTTNGGGVSALKWS